MSSDSIPEDEVNAPESAEGTLVVIICRAKHLPNRRTLDKQSPYVALRVGTIAKKTQAHFRAGQTPEWLQEVRFQLTRDRKPIMKVDVLDETKNDPTPIGNVEIDCSIIFRNPDNQQEGKYIYDKWFDLTLNGRRAGMIYLEMTFYPSAPILPPKIPYEVESTYSVTEKNLPSPPPKPTPMGEVFTAQEPSGFLKRFGFLKNQERGSTGSQGSHDSYGNHSPSNGYHTHQKSQDSQNYSKISSDNSDVFVSSQQELTGTKKYSLKFSKFKSKFQAKEPIGSLFHNEGRGKKSPNRFPSPVSAYEIDSYQVNNFDNLDQLQNDISGYDDDDFAPPIPLHKSSKDLPILRATTTHSHSMSPPPSDPNPPSPPHSISPSHLHRKAPSSPVRESFSKLNLKSNTSIPFSADTIGLTDEQPLPTQVYLLDKPVKSLSYENDPNATNNNLNDDMSYRINPNEIDPKFYAPTPSEHLNTKFKLENGVGVTREDLKVDFRTDSTGYLGNGKFFPSIFQRAVEHDYDDELLDYAMKPKVPPKIPQGLTEMEYYVLEKERYLKDLNGRRM